MLYLVFEAKSAAALSRASGVNSAYISQIKKRTPSGTGKPREVGDSMARRLEHGAGKPKFWMDAPHLELWVSAGLSDCNEEHVLNLSRSQFSENGWDDLQSYLDYLRSRGDLKDAEPPE